MRPFKLWLCLSIFVWCCQSGSRALADETLTVAAAADLTYAMKEIATAFKHGHPHDQIQTLFGSSGQLFTQIQQGAPYDVFFSADIRYPRLLKARGWAGSEITTYAFGRIVLWSASRNVKNLTLQQLRDPSFRNIAIANPNHAPYGQRAVEALKAAGVYAQVQPKLIYGENVAQTAQFVQSGNAQVGIIALALALNPQLAHQGSYSLIPASMHQPLEQGFVITRQAAHKPLALAFAQFIKGSQARAILARNGFILPKP